MTESEPMTEPTPQQTTFERSCAHWSAEGQLEMEAFYRLASVDYELLAKQVQWPELLTRLQSRFDSPLRLLDVACGSGQFPSALLEHGGVAEHPDLHIEYTLLDPSQFSIEAARQKLRTPFEAAEELLCTAQEIPTPSAPYPLVWATHALYCVPPAELELALDRMLQVMDPQGLGFIAHASHESHYLRFHDLYLQTGWGGEALPYCRGEEITTFLSRKLDSSRLKHWAIDYEGTVPLDDRETAERYLQRCLFDDSISLSQMLASDVLGPYLRRCMDESTGMWRFRQKTWLIFYGELAESAEELRGSS